MRNKREEEKDLFLAGTDFGLGDAPDLLHSVFQLYAMFSKDLRFSSEPELNRIKVIELTKGNMHRKECMQRNTHSNLGGKTYQ